MAKDTTNFNVSEFACHCCGNNDIKQEVLNLCQKIRDELGMPVRINSGYRCSKHNSKVSKASNSQHTFGNAADLSCPSGGLAILLAVHKLFLEGNLPELGYCIYYPNKNFVHVDIVPRPSANIFSVLL